MQNKQLTIVGIALAIALFLAVNLLAGPALRGVRADLTEQKLYTLSEGTRNILGGLEEDITLRYFFARKLASKEKGADAILPYANRVLEMLEQYQNASDGKITLEVIDPEEFSEEEELAVGYGIQGRRVSMGSAKLYIGLVGTNSVDDEEVIPVLEPARESSLEYELTELIDRLANPELPVLGLVSGLQLRGGTTPPANQFSQPQQTPPWPILQLIEQRYEIRDLDPATLEEIPEEVTMLLLVQPKGLTDKGLYAIDQFALAGGKVCAFVDPVTLFDPASSQQPPMPGADVTGMDRLLGAWGVPLASDKVAGDENTGVQIMSRSERPVTLPVYFDVIEEGLNADDILTQSVKPMKLLMAGSFDVTPVEGLDVTTLMSTTDGGGSVGRSLVTQQMDEETLAASFVKSGEALPLGVRLRGNATTAFPGGLEASAEAPEAEGADGEDSEDKDGESEPEAPDVAHLETSSAPFNAVVVADADMLHENLWAQRVQSLFGGMSYRAANGNAPLLIGALENLSGSDDLISLRSRAEYSRPFTLKQELQREAQEKFSAEQQALDAKLAEAQSQIDALQTEKDPQSAFILSPEQEEAIAKFRDQEVETRRELRRVRRNLNAETEALGTRLKLLNILLIPAIITALGATFLILRRGGAKA